MKGGKITRNVSYTKNSSRFLSKHKSKFDILEWEHKTIATQLTYITFNLLGKIQIKEFLNTAWSKKNKLIEAPNIYKAIEQFNSLYYWVIEEILSYDDKIQRAKCIEKFIYVADSLREMNNFNDCVNIIMSLNNDMIQALKITLNLVPQKAKVIFNELNNVINYSRNFAVLRKCMLGVKGKPAVPYLLLFLRDLAILEESCEYVKDEYLVNLYKIKKVGNIIDYFLGFRANVYMFKDIEDLSILKDPRPKSEQELEKISQKLGNFF